MATQYFLKDFATQEQVDYLIKEGDLKMETKFKNLNELCNAMIADEPSTLDQHGQWRTDLPIFGNKILECPEHVWSWDSKNAIVGTCASDLEIKPIKIENNTLEVNWEA